MSQLLRQSILKTLAWFDLFSYPLTPQELQRYLWEPPKGVSFDTIQSELESMQDINMTGGFYHLSGRKDIIAQRQCSVPIIEKKLQVARRACKKVRWIPFVRAVFVCNTVAAATASSESDIDVLIVIKDGRMWLTRFFITIALSLVRLRRHGRHVANKVCLSFFVTERALNFSNIRWGNPDIYLAYWLLQLIPLFDPYEIHEILQRENAWVRMHVPHGFAPYLLSPRYRVMHSRASRKISSALEILWKGTYGDLLEQQAKHIQELKMKRNYDSVQGESDSRVIISDSMLKFHENDRRQQYREQWENALRE